MVAGAIAWAGWRGACLAPWIRNQACVRTGRGAGLSAGIGRVLAPACNRSRAPNGLCAARALASPPLITRQRIQGRHQPRVGTTARMPLAWHFDAPHARPIGAP